MKPQKIAIWVLATSTGHFLYYGNMNRTVPPYHVRDIEAMTRGHHLVWEHTKSGLESTGIQKLWNRPETAPYMKVYPKKVIVEIRDFATKKNKEK